MTPSLPNSSAQVAIERLPEYEKKLLLALAFFLGRDISAQALACLSMYLRQSEPRVMAQVKYYAHKAQKQSGITMDAYDLLDLIATEPDRVTQILAGVVPVHEAQSQDAFSEP